jgi:hypothetical protein
MKHQMKYFEEKKLSTEAATSLIEKVRTADNLLMLLRS